jgi:Fe-S cluster biogenesis protein NfuA
MLLEDRELMTQAAKIETLLHEIEAFPNPATRDKVAEIVQAVLALHGEGMARMLEIVARQTDGAISARTLEQFAEDDLISHLLLLHDLHPVDVEIRVEQALEGVRPYLKSHGGNVELIGVEEGVARLRLEGHCKSCPSSTMTLKHTVEEAIRKAAPELIEIVAEEPPRMPNNFVPMAALLGQPS